MLRERFSGSNTNCKRVLFRDINKKFVLWNFSICIDLKSNCVWLSKLWGLRGLAPVLPSGSPHRPIARFHSNPPIIAEYAPMRGNLLCKREQSETQFQLCRVQPATDDSQIAAVQVKFPFVKSWRARQPLLSLDADTIKSRGLTWRCAVMTMRRVATGRQLKRSSCIGAAHRG